MIPDLNRDGRGSCDLRPCKPEARLAVFVYVKASGGTEIV